MKRVWVDSDKCLGCKTCELQCAVERGSVSKMLVEAVKEDPKPVARVGVFGPSGSSFPLQCRHCQDAMCLKVCPAGAMQRDTEKGNIAANQDKCRGCWMCVMACPFGCITPSTEYKVALKCDACMHMEEPACVASCPTGALVYGDESSYSKVLTARRGSIAVMAASLTEGKPSGIVSIELLREDR